jgi:hypothetical protein
VSDDVYEGKKLLSKEEEATEPDNDDCCFIEIPELIVPFRIFSFVALVDDFGCVMIVSLIESMLSCETAIPALCCFFFFAKSYMSPNIPAKVLRRFFIVSSASSTTDDCCVGRGGCDACVLPDCDDWEAWESRRPVLASDGAEDSELSTFAPLKLPWRAIDPTPGVWRSGIGGPAEDGGNSSVGLPTVGLDWDFGIGGRQTFWKRIYVFLILTQTHNEYKFMAHLHTCTDNVSNCTTIFLLCITN